MLECALNNPEHAQRMFRTLGVPQLNRGKERRLQGWMAGGQVERAQEFLLKRIPDLADAMGPLEKATRGLGKEFHALLTNMGKNFAPRIVRFAEAISKALERLNQLTESNAEQAGRQFSEFFERKFPNRLERLNALVGRDPNSRHRTVPTPRRHGGWSLYAPERPPTTRY